MLFLTRKIGQEIVINDDVRIVVTKIDGQYVKLGFEFPSTYKVWRKEIWDRMKNERREACQCKTVLCHCHCPPGACLYDE